MTRKLKYTSLLLPLLAAFAACSDEVVDAKDPDQGKSPIELSVGGIDTPSSQTRAVITDGTDKTKHFDENTSLYMLMKSEDITDGTTKPALVTRTIMFALPQTDSSKDYLEVNYSASDEYAKFVRYWEDSYSRSSALSILAVCTPGMGPSSTTPDKKTWNISGSDAGYQNRAWEEISSSSATQPYTSIFWPVSAGKNNISATDQSLLSNDVSFIKNEDLCFSNNIGDWSSVSGKTDARMKFNSNDDRKFDAGTLFFYHALSKLTFQIKMGAGFSSTDFKFEDGTNIKLQNFNNSGTFHMEDGEFISSTITKNDILRIYNRPTSTFSDAEKTANYKYILDALVIPNTEMNDGETTGVVFCIDGNQYKLSMKQLYDAIKNNPAYSEVSDWSKYFDKNSSDAYSLLKAGVHYVFTFTVGKTKIEKITAQLVPWEEVTSIDFDASNARIELELLDRGEAQSSGVKFYRALNYKEGGDINDNWAQYEWLNKKYETDVATYVDGHWTTTNWLWESNRHFYHFRALIPDNVSVVNNGDTDPNPTFGLVAKKKESDTDTYNDVKWGAPFLDPGEADYKLTYSTTKGFDGKGAESSETTHQIYKAIGPTKETITLVSFHMMSEVTITVKTTTQFDNVDFDGSDNNGVTTVELLNCYQNASVQLGDGLVYPTGETATIPFNPSLTSNVLTQTATWGMVPQSLTGVQLRVTTADGNQYFVDMDKIKVNAASVTNVNLANPYHVITEADVDNTNIKPADVGKCIVNYWYPDYKYSYTFTLTKQGIKDLVATIVDWETVTADDETVQIQ